MSTITLFHPETLRVQSPVGPYELLRVDHPAADPIRDGEPTLGWEGDPMLQLYLDGADQRWVIVRLENDGEYRVTAVSPPGAMLNTEFANSAIRQLLAHDTRRGFKPKEAVDAHNDGVKQANQKKVDDWMEGHLADRMRWALKKDGADKLR